MMARFADPATRPCGARPARGAVSGRQP